MTEGWIDASGEWVQPDDLAAADEVVARLRAHQTGDLQAYLSPAARWEQGLEPVVLPPGDGWLAERLLAVSADQVAVHQVLRKEGQERARAVLRRVVVEWSKPKREQQQLWPYLQLRGEGVTWTLEEIGAGVTAVRLQASISSRLADETPYRVFYPTPDLEQIALEPWWNILEPEALRLKDDLRTPYELSWSEAETSFPLRVIATGGEGARAAQRYTLVFAPGVPLGARSLSLSAKVSLAIEMPLTQIPPWPIRELFLGELTCTIDLQGWWPDVVRPDQSWD
jgi:hypothetical protein